MDEPYILSRLSCEDYKHGQAILNPVKAAQPCHRTALGLDEVLVAGALLSVFPDEMLPLEIPRGWNNATVRNPGVSERRFLLRDARIGPHWPT